MQTPSEIDIESIFHNHCPDDNHVNETCFSGFKKELLAAFRAQSPESVLSALQAFTFHKLAKTNRQQYLDLHTQLVRELFSNHRKISDCMFFPSKENEAKLIDYLKLATKELDLCIFTLTNNALASTLLALVEEKNVKVRIISDDANLAHMGSDLATLASKIPVRTDRDLFAHMHNKYVVIDKRILITGSFNWTGQAVSRNNENVVILEDEELSMRYLEDFDRLWKEFEANVVTGKGDLDRLRPKDPTKKRGRKKKEETEEEKKEKEEKLRKKQEKKELQEKKKLEKLEKKEKKEKKPKAEKPAKEKKERKKRETKEKKVPSAEKKISKREKMPRKAKKEKTRHVSFKVFLARKKLILERNSINPKTHAETNVGQPNNHH